MSQVPPPSRDPSRVTPATRPDGLRTPGAPARAATTAAPAQPVSWNDPSQRIPLIQLGGLVALLVAAYWDMFSLTSAAWSEGLYSHGWIVPLFALALLWLRWQPFTPVPTSERWLGVLLLAMGLGARLFAA